MKKKVEKKPAKILPKQYDVSVDDGYIWHTEKKYFDTEKERDDYAKTIGENVICRGYDGISITRDTSKMIYHVYYWVRGEKRKEDYKED